MEINKQASKFTRRVENQRAENPSMAELLRKHRVYAHPNPNPNPDPRANSSFEPDPSPQYYRNRSKGRPWKQKEGPHVAGLKKEEEKENEEEMIRKAAAILLSRAWSSLSRDLCECCSASLNSRLITMASSNGKCFGFVRGNDCGLDFFEMTIGNVHWSIFFWNCQRGKENSVTCGKRFFA